MKSGWSYANGRIKKGAGLGWDWEKWYIRKIAVKDVEKKDSCKKQKSKEQLQKNKEQLRLKEAKKNAVIWIKKMF